MRAYEYPVKVSSEGKLELPDALLKVLPPNQIVRVIILMNEHRDGSADADWSEVSAQQFLAGYVDADAAYDTI
jgi:hypothetical protein